jgi:hypothetical protein
MPRQIQAVNATKLSLNKSIGMGIHFIIHGIEMIQDDAKSIVL